MTDETIPPCRRCKGLGVFEWAPGKSGPCFLCNGTGDGRIQNYSGFGPRRPGGKRRYGQNGQGHGGHAIPATPTETVPAETEDDGAPVPMPGPAVMTAAEHLAAALAGLQTTAPLDEDAVRAILHNEFAEQQDSLGQTIADIQRQITEAAAGIPRRLVIEIGERMGEMPAVRHYRAEKLLRIIAAKKRAYVVGPAGSGKTTVARQIAETLGLKFYYQGAMSGSHCILGYKDSSGTYQTTPTREAVEHGGLLLIDEIDGSEPDAALCIHPLDNGHMSFPDRPEPIAIHPDFRLIVAANTYGRGADRLYVGRTQLDAATLNRFVFFEFNYDETLERHIAGDTEWTTFVQSARRAIETLKIRHVVSPRNAIDGNDLIAAGFEREEVEAMALWQGLSDADITRVRSAMI